MLETALDRESGDKLGYFDEITWDKKYRATVPLHSK
jgi:hypothetical protein